MVNRMKNKFLFYGAVGTNGYAIYDSYQRVKNNGEKYLGCRVHCKGFIDYDKACEWCYGEFQKLYSGYYSMLPRPYPTNTIIFRKQIDREVQNASMHTSNSIPLVTFSNVK